MPANNSVSQWVQKRPPVRTTKSSREIATADESLLRQNVFFSARVSEMHIIERLKKVSDAVSRGEMGVAEARGILKEFIHKDVERDDGQGAPPKGTPEYEKWKATRSLKNLGSTARLNLILEQNRLMANSVAKYAEGMDPDIAERWPYWRYCCVGDGRSRPAHVALNGKIFKKTDPVWNTIFPPNGFNCRCYVEDVGDDEVNPGQVSNSKSVKPQMDEVNGEVFRFNPRNAFASWDLNAISDPKTRASAAAKLGSQESVEKAFGVRIFPDRVVNGRMKYLNAKELNLPEIDKSALVPLVFDKNNQSSADLRAGKSISVDAPDGSTVVFDKGVVDHFTIAKGHSKNDIPLERLNYVDSALQTIKNAKEKWTIEDSTVYISPVSSDDKSKYIMVTVGNDGKVITYHLVEENQLNKVRKGIGYEIF